MIDRLLCFFQGHPGWRETTIVPEPGSLGQQYVDKGLGPIQAEYRAAIFGARAWRCTRCHHGKVTL